ncbi:MAG: succinate dehydrogenase assembly factor 2 [Alphaproteobacteria bacterium]|nr:MAG: succinate dehydrogenase assembly factor 2 [Alphaproteobacteria bacterium]
MANTAILRKKLYFQSTHRGTKENDLVLTRFVDRHMDDFDASGLELYQKFLNEPDHDLYAWLIKGEGNYPMEYAELVAKIRAANNV